MCYYTCEFTETEAVTQLVIKLKVMKLNRSL